MNTLILGFIFVSIVLSEKEEKKQNKKQLEEDQNKQEEEEEEEEEEVDKLSLLRTLSRASPSGIWEPISPEFEEFVMQGPRNYSVIVLFTSETNDLVCQSCSIVRAEFERYCGFYISEFSPSRREVFFVVVEWKRNKDIFQKNKKLKEMPMIVLIPPTSKSGTQFKWPVENRYPIQTDLNAESLVIYFNKYLSQKVPLPDPVSLSYVNYLLLIIFVGSIVKNFYQYRYEKNFWMCVSMFVIWFTYTGTIWNINRGAPFLIGGESITLIYPQQRMQTVLEGVIAASLLIIIGGIFASFTVYISRMKKEAELKYYFYLAATVFSSLFMVLNVFWLRKTPWYLRYG